MRKLATRGRPRVVIGDDDSTLTAQAGLGVVGGTDRGLGIGAEIDAGGGAVKARPQGLGAGGLVLATAEMMLAGGDFMVDLDHQRADVVGRGLRAVPDIPSSSTFIALSKRTIAVGQRVWTSTRRTPQHITTHGF